MPESVVCEIGKKRVTLRGILYIETLMDNHADVDWLIETSWEVCNKVGGIYTVLSTKAKNLHKLYGDRLIFIGPDVWSETNPSPFFRECPRLLKQWRSSLCLPEGVTVRVGRWEVPGKPLAILVKFDGMYALKDSFYGRMWELYGVDSLHAYGDYDEACAFSHAAGLLIESLYDFHKGQGGNFIAHFDEWTTGMGLLYVKAARPEIATIFTTHATSIGRSICGNNKNLYQYLTAYDGDQMASELNMQSKHSVEKAAAHQADCFTTVSEVTAKECTQLLGRCPDIVTPNGFEPNFVPAKNRFKASRRRARQRLLEVAGALTGREYADDETFILCTSGRCEYRNKGLDLFLDSIARLRQLQPCRRTLAFVMVPAWSGEARSDLKSALEHESHRRLADPVITHHLHNYDSDAIISRIHSIGLSNDETSQVDVIYVPCYLNGSDGVFNLTYYELLIGMDATVFPSYYEPWGYTPLESIAFGVPTITTSLSGFGQWVLDGFTDTFETSGVYVVERTDTNYGTVCESIANSLRFLTCCDSTQSHAISEQAMQTASQADWNLFIRYYIDAFRIAVDNEKRRNRQ